MALGDARISALEDVATHLRIDCVLERFGNGRGAISARVREIVAPR